jgi:1-acyl-sn-glycerol-3-phosphate acyltransferase
MLYFINTVLLVLPLLVFSVFKLAPSDTWRRWMSSIIDNIANLWIRNNNLNQRIFSRTKFITKGNAKLALDSWYLVVSNHQSWVDILVLQRIFIGKIPFLKFFLKKSLIYVPFLGLAWWALDFPFMRRYSRAFIKKHPHLKGKDLETTKKACEKFEFKPVSIMNFVEGTRYLPTKAKDHDQFRHLLAPKSGGIAFVLNSMGERLDKLVNVTIYYPDGIPSYWDFICGKVDKIVVDVETINIKTLLENGTFNERYFTSDEQRRVFQDWMNQLWLDKDAKLEQMNQEYNS